MRTRTHFHRFSIFIQIWFLLFVKPTLHLLGIISQLKIRNNIRTDKFFPRNITQCTNQICFLKGPVAKKLVILSPPPRLRKILIRNDCHAMTDEIGIAVIVGLPVKLRIKLFVFFYNHSYNSIVCSQCLCPQHCNIQ